MRYILNFAIFLILCSITGILSIYSEKINNHGQVGQVVFGTLAELHKWKWMAAILIEHSNQFFQHCGGSLVSDQHILTAAHCLIENGSAVSAQSLIVRLGQYDLRQKGQDFKVAYYVLHPRFNRTTLYNDIAVIKLGKKAKFSEIISPIKLPKIKQAHNYETEKGKEVAFIAGWGRTSFRGEFNDELLEARLHIADQMECRTAYDSYANITAQQICAKAPEYSANSSDACPGDSGGPLIQLDQKLDEYLLTGVISFGRRCGLKNVPGVYTKVESYVNWIKQIIPFRKRSKY